GGRREALGARRDAERGARGIRFGHPATPHVHQPSVVEDAPGVCGRDRTETRREATGELLREDAGSHPTILARRAITTRRDAAQPAAGRAESRRVARNGSGAVTSTPPASSSSSDTRTSTVEAGSPSR